MKKTKQTPKDAASIKDAGNKLFARGEFEQAAKFYERGIRMIDSKSKKENGSSTTSPGIPLDDDTIYLKAVCLSNLSNCWFELGDYAKSVTVAQSCVTVLNALKETSVVEQDKIRGLYLKNILRMARAYFYGRNVEDSIQMLQELAACENQAYAKRAKKMLTQVSQYQHNNNNNDGKKTPEALLQKPVRLLRTALMEPIVEYYRFGHNGVRSALEEGPNFNGKQADTSPKIRLKDCLELDILMAGINDGRHVLATIMDVHAQYKELLGDKKENVKLRIVCNDINRASQARFVLTLVILHKIGKLAKQRKDVKTNKGKKASQWCAVLQYILLSHAMPPWVKDMAVAAMEEIMEFKTPDAFEKSYPWLQCTSEQDWKQILPILSYWIAQVGGKNHNKHSTLWDDIPDVKECLGRHLHLKEPLDQGLDINPSAPQAQAMMSARRAHAKAEMDAYVLRMSDFNNWSPQMKQQMRLKFGPGITDEDMVKAYLSTIGETLDLEDFDEKLSSRKHWMESPGIELAQSFLKSTRVLLPPSRLSECSAFSKIYDKDKGRFPGSKQAVAGCIDPADLKEAEDAVMSTWSTNPFMFDPLYHSVLFSEQRFSPVLDFLNDYMNCAYGSDVISEETKVRALFCESQAGTQSDPELAEFFDWTSCFFWNAAHALVSLCEQSDALQVEWNVGDIVSVCQRYRQAGTKRFHRAFLSNIPDYTGILPVFTDIMPLLHENKPKVSSHIHLDILLNCQCFGSYAQYIFSTTAVPTTRKAENLFGMKYLGNAEDCAWREYVWTRSGIQKHMSKDEFRRWLHRLFLLTILPPVRPFTEPIRVNYPNNVAAFVHTCKFCVDELKYPTHWISCALDELVSASSDKQFSTKAIIPASDPPQPTKSEGQDHKVDISAFTLDLRTQMAINMQQRQLSKLPLLSSLDASSLACLVLQQYELTMPITVNPLGDDYHPSYQSMGLVLEPTKPEHPMDDVDEDKMDDVTKQMFRSMSRMIGRFRSPIRDDILAQGSKSFHVLSCLEWEMIDMGESNRLRFCMSPQDFDHLRYHYVSLLRTDGWFRIGKPIQLLKAKAIY
ncbi:expressed unknown protein [Seminavis robusta]|uniref:DUF4470 domain-containing protein n=1 Tax=Seminavis robusta TaxID=568900 RepID=A0A9N8H943_9STRA|nr:expressed unknown protein [Seminavis robusta]|eukprot:Sro242_g096640.1 n/a (1069) ;mRNA; f:48687-51893